MDTVNDELFISAHVTQSGIQCNFTHHKNTSLGQKSKVPSNSTGDSLLTYDIPKHRTDDTFVQLQKTQKA